MNAEKKTIVKNFGQLLFSMIVLMIATFFCYTLLGRKMTVDDYAIFSSILALTTMTSVFVNNIAAGIVANREIAIKPFASYKILKTFFGIRLFSCLIAFIILSYYVTNKYPDNKLVLLPAIMLLTTNVFFELYEQIAFGLKVTKISMLLNIFTVLVWLALVIALPKNKSSVYLVTLCYATICLIKTVCYGVWINKKTKKYVNVEYHVPTKQLILYSLPYLYNRILGTLTTQLPVLLLAGYSELSETAYYSMGEKYTAPITAIASSATSALFPFFTKVLKEDHRKAAKYVSDGILLVISFGACIAVVLCSMSEYWLVLLLGEKYKGAVEAFNFQVWFAIINSVDSIISMILSGDYKQKLLSVITTVDVAVSLLFIWKGIGGGAKGVALAKLFAAVICLAYHLVLISKLYGDRHILLRLLASWIIFILLLYAVLFQDNYMVRIISPIVAFGGCIALNRKSLVVFYKQIRGLMRKG